MVKGQAADFYGRVESTSMSDTFPFVSINKVVPAANNMKLEMDIDCNDDIIDLYANQW
jgi:hypothetical protein